MAKLWPTPSASDNANRRSKPTPAEMEGRHGWGLRSAIADNAQTKPMYEWPTGSSPEASPAPTFRMPEKEPGLLGNSPVFGTRCTELFASYDPDSQSLKTSQLSLLGESTPFSGRFPRSGTMRAGKLYERQTWVRRTEGNESGSWPTPQAQMPGAGPENSKVKNLLTGNRHSFYLPQAVEAERQKPGVITGMWPTPHANSHTGPGEHGDGGPNLQTAVAQQGYANRHNRKKKRYPTPQAGANNPAAHRAMSGDFKTKLCKAWGIPTTGQLAPDWVDALMGYMPGWTDGSKGFHVSLLKSRTE